ncbi:transposase [Cupriavidus sp. KK10]|uniref:transposase n=1 Tax=Cupriavidus sp. KK10 TaxID=1478019 RepID=UPI0020118F1E|nr:transposase [Cupriavidus sp. KK10]
MAETLDPTRSLAEVARSHGLNANLVSNWRRHQQRAAASASEPAELFLPIERWHRRQCRGLAAIREKSATSPATH